MATQALTTLGIPANVGTWVAAHAMTGTVPHHSLHTSFGSHEAVTFTPSAELDLSTLPIMTGIRAIFFGTASAQTFDLLGPNVKRPPYTEPSDLLRFSGGDVFLVPFNSSAAAAGFARHLGSSDVSRANSGFRSIRQEPNGLNTHHFLMVYMDGNPTQEALLVAPRLANGALALWQSSNEAPHNQGFVVIGGCTI